MTERTLVLIKPDGVERRLIGEILSRIERKGLTIAALELRTSATSSPGALRRARGQAVLRVAAGVHHLRSRGGRDRGRARVPLRRSGRSPAGPIRWRRRRPAPSAVTWHLSPRTTSSTAPIRPSRRPVKSTSGSPANSTGNGRLVGRLRRDVGYCRVAGPIPGSDTRMKTSTSATTATRGAAPTVQPSFSQAPRGFTASRSGRDHNKLGRSYPGP